MFPSPYVSRIMVEMSPTKRWCLKFKMWSCDWICYSTYKQNCVPPSIHHIVFCTRHNICVSCLVWVVTKIFNHSWYHDILLEGVLLDLSFVFLLVSFHVILVVDLWDIYYWWSTLSNSRMNPGRQDRLSLFNMGTMLWQPELYDECVRIYSF